MDAIKLINYNALGLSKLEKFLNSRNLLIDKLESNEISKKDFILMNYDLVTKLNILPYSTIDSYEKGIFNYQYFNLLAKYWKMEGDKVKGIQKKHKYYKLCYGKTQNYYREKDKATIGLLDFVEYRDIDAYYIIINSKSLNDEIFEIVLKSYSRSILHSKSIEILNNLKKKNVFLKEKRKSIIDDYINNNY